MPFMPERTSQPRSTFDKFTSQKKGLLATFEHYCWRKSIENRYRKQLDLIPELKPLEIPLTPKQQSIVTDVITELNRRRHECALPSTAVKLQMVHLLNTDLYTARALDQPSEKVAGVFIPNKPPFNL
jgi:hypothetical protein